MRKNGKLSILITCIATCILLSSFILLGITQIQSKRTETAVEAVKDLYQFNQVNELNNNMKNLKKITTSSVYNQLTVDNEERTLNTYLKFKGNPTTVNVIDVTNSYVLYSLTNENIDEDRVFIFMYSFDSKGKICKVRESECLDFLQQ